MTLKTVGGHAVWIATSDPAADTLHMHCSLARHEALLPLAKALGVSWCAFELPRQGRSADWDGQGDYQQAVVDVAVDLLDRPMHLIAHSLSATAALRVAMLRPDMVSRLTLIESVYFAFAKGTAAYDLYARDFAGIDAAMAQDDRRLPPKSLMPHGAYQTGTHCQPAHR